MILLGILAFLAILAGALAAIRGAINAMFRSGIDSRPHTLGRDQGVPQEVAEALRRGEKIRAIELWRGATGASLRDAKDFIEDVQRRGG